MQYPEHSFPLLSLSVWLSHISVQRHETLGMFSLPSHASLIPNFTLTVQTDRQKGS